jgi:hypothetical protein
VGGVDLAGRLFARSRTGRPAARTVDWSSTSRPHHPLDGTARLVVGTTSLGLAATRHPLAAIEQVGRLGRSLLRALAPVGTGSPLFARRGLDRRLDAIQVPLRQLQRAADRIDCSLNDVFLAAVGGALHAYHRHLGHPIAVLQCTMPINLRRGSDQRGGNRFAPARFALPIDDPDPVARARIAGAISRRWRAEPALPHTAAVSAALDALPGPVVTRLLGGMLKGVDVDVVNVPGLRRAPYFAGARVDQLWAFAPPTGAALSVTLLSHVDTCCIGLNVDRAAVEAPELMRQCLESSLAEVVQLDAANAPRRRPA